MNRVNYGLAFGGLLGFLAVGMGAYADHVLKPALSAHDFDAVETAARYQLIHAVVLAGLGLARLVTVPRNVEHYLTLATALFLTGIILFSGGIYAGVLLPAEWALHVAPVGGSLLMLGWLVLGFAGLNKGGASR